VEIADDQIVGVRLRDGELVARQAIAVATHLVARASFLMSLGLRAVPHPSGTGEHVPAEPGGRTDVPGVWVAGNVTELRAQVGERGLLRLAQRAQPWTGGIQRLFQIIVHADQFARLAS
jgi:hypothetical protein